MPTQTMRHAGLPRLTFQRKTLLGDNHWHSILISLLRGSAAIIVAAAHVRAIMYPGLRTITDPPLWFQGFAFFTGFAHQAVLVFFIISGWLVGGSLLNKLDMPGAYLDYAIDRLTRLWTVLIPTFILTLLFGVTAGIVDIGKIDYSAANEYSTLVFVGNLFGLQRIFLPDFGGNFALWSLTNETWYYVLFLLLVLLFSARKQISRAASALAVLAIIAMLPSAVTAYFLIWLLGVAFSRIRIECSSGLRLGWLMLLLSVATYFRLTGTLDDFSTDTLRQDLILSLMFLCFLSSLQFHAAPTSTLVLPLTHIGNFFAQFSFSLYVLHVPLLELLAYWSKTYLGLRQLSPHKPLHLGIYVSMLVILLVAANISYRLFEAQTYRVRYIVKCWAARARGLHPIAQRTN